MNVVESRGWLSVLLCFGGLAMASEAPVAANDSLSWLLEESTELAIVQNIGLGVVGGVNRVIYGAPSPFLQTVSDCFSISQIPNAMFRAAAEADRSMLQEATGAFAALAESTVPDQILAETVGRLVDATAFNVINARVREQYPQPEQEYERRAARIAGVMMFRYLAIMFLRACLRFNEMLPVGGHVDSWRKFQVNQAQRIYLNEVFMTNTAKHIFYEFAGSVVKRVLSELGASAHTAVATPEQVVVES